MRILIIFSPDFVCLPKKLSFFVQTKSAHQSTSQQELLLIILGLTLAPWHAAYWSWLALVLPGWHRFPLPAWQGAGPGRLRLAIGLRPAGGAGPVTPVCTGWSSADSG